MWLYDELETFTFQISVNIKNALESVQDQIRGWYLKSGLQSFFSSGGWGIWSPTHDMKRKKNSNVVLYKFIRTLSIRLFVSLKWWPCFTNSLTCFMLILSMFSFFCSCACYAQEMSLFDVSLRKKTGFQIITDIIIILYINTDTEINADPLHAYIFHWFSF